MSDHNRKNSIVCISIFYFLYLFFIIIIGIYLSVPPYEHVVFLFIGISSLIIPLALIIIMLLNMSKYIFSIGSSFHFLYFLINVFVAIWNIYYSIVKYNYSNYGVSIYIILIALIHLSLYIAWSPSISTTEINELPQSERFHKTESGKVDEKDGENTEQ